MTSRAFIQGKGKSRNISRISEKVGERKAREDVRRYTWSGFQAVGYFRVKFGNDSVMLWIRTICVGKSLRSHGRRMMSQEFLTTDFHPKSWVLQERRTSFFRCLLIPGTNGHKLSGPDKLLYSVHFLWSQIHSFCRKADIRPVFQKTRPFATDLSKSGEKHAFFRTFEKTEHRESPGLSIPDRENHIATLRMRRISRSIEQWNRFTGITEILTFPVPAITFPLRGTLATLVF